MIRSREPSPERKATLMIYNTKIYNTKDLRVCKN